MKRFLCNESEYAMSLLKWAIQTEKDQAQENRSRTTWVYFDKPTTGETCQT